MQIPFDNSYARLGEPFSRAHEPVPVAAPSLLMLNDALATQLGLPIPWLRSDEGIAALAGNQLLPGSEPVSTAYAGHQFGTFNPQLGDGRAVLLGEIVGKDGRRFDIQLKGSGRTPWSRGGDGRSPLGPVIREYIVSEAMAALGVPTTRALAAVRSGEQVIREYAEQGAVLTRIASSHLRVGTLQYFAAREDTVSVERIALHALQRHFPDHAESDNPALDLLQQVIGAQAKLIARWQLLGFVHGVMNTDNMLLCGETVDYGPCAFMENFDPATVFSSIDHQGRYAYQNQPAIAHWNLARLAETLLPLIDQDSEKALELATTAIQSFPKLFEQAHREGLAAKLGIAQLKDEDTPLVNELFEALQADQTDFTLSFRYLTEQGFPSNPQTGIDDLFTPGVRLLEWLPKWMQRLEKETVDPEQRQQDMLIANPVFIPRNHLVQRAISAAEDGDDSVFARILARVAEPFTYDSADQDLASPAQAQERVLRTFCGT